MAKAKLTTRQETNTTVTSNNFGKGSELSFAEADSNFLNLRDTTFGVTGDDSATIQIGMDSTLYIQGGTNITTATNSDGTITINSSAALGGNGFRIFGDDSAGVDIADGGNLYIQGGTNVTTATNSDGTITINSSASGTGLVEGSMTINSVSNVTWTLDGGSSTVASRLFLKATGNAGDSDTVNNAIHYISYSGRHNFGTQSGNGVAHITTEAGDGDSLKLSALEATIGDGITIDGTSSGLIELHQPTKIGGINISTDNVISTAADDSTTLTITTSGSGNMNLSAETITMSSSVHIGLGGDEAGGLIIEDNTISTARSNENLELDANGTGGIEILTQVVRMANLPTSDPSSAGQLWNDSNTLKISAG